MNVRTIFGQAVVTIALSLAVSCGGSAGEETPTMPGDDADANDSATVDDTSPPEIDPDTGTPTTDSGIDDGASETIADALPDALDDGDATSSDSISDSSTFVDATSDATVPSFCDVDALMKTKCTTCHGSGSFLPLVTAADLSKKSTAYPTQTYAERSSVRMKAGTMPPAGGATPADIAMLDSWIASAYASTTCGGSDAGTDAGDATVVDTGVGDAADTSVTDAGPTGIPCDVDTLLKAKCVSCHNTGSFLPLVTYADLTAMSSTYPTQTYAQRSSVRMTAGTMPPGGGATTTEIASLDAWITAGYPKGSCGGTDGGTDATIDTSFDTTPPPPVCTSGKYWTSGTSGDPRMLPGRDCIACHKTMGGPTYVIAGTVYPTLHEPDNCNGVNGTTTGAKVVATDTAGKVVTINVNSVGNFYWNGTLTLPFKVKVTVGTTSRDMLGSLTNGACNSCHTVTGASGAPGRIYLP